MTEHDVAAQCQEFDALLGELEEAVDLKDRKTAKKKVKQIQAHTEWAALGDTMMTEMNNGTYKYSQADRMRIQTEYEELVGEAEGEEDEPKKGGSAGIIVVLLLVLLLVGLGCWLHFKKGIPCGSWKEKASYMALADAATWKTIHKPGSVCGAVPAVVAAGAAAPAQTTTPVPMNFPDPQSETSVPGSLELEVAGKAEAFSKDPSALSAVQGAVAGSLKPYAGGRRLLASVEDVRQLGAFHAVKASDVSIMKTTIKSKDHVKVEYAVGVPTAEFDSKFQQRMDTLKDKSTMLANFSSAMELSGASYIADLKDCSVDVSKAHLAAAPSKTHTCPSLTSLSTKKPVDDDFPKGTNKADGKLTLYASCAMELATDKKGIKGIKNALLKAGTSCVGDFGKPEPPPTTTPAPTTAPPVASAATTPVAVAPAAGRLLSGEDFREVPWRGLQVVTPAPGVTVAPVAVVTAAPTQPPTTPAPVVDAWMIITSLDTTLGGELSVSYSIALKDSANGESIGGCLSNINPHELQADLNRALTDEVGSKYNLYMPGGEKPTTQAPTTTTEMQMRRLSYV